MNLNESHQSQSSPNGFTDSNSDLLNETGANVSPGLKGFTDSKADLDHLQMFKKKTHKQINILIRIEM